jgi:hypothetical protein
MQFMFVDPGRGHMSGHHVLRWITISEERWMHEVRTHEGLKPEVHLEC